MPSNHKEKGITDSSLRAHSLFFLKNKFYLFIYFWLCWVFIAACQLSLVAASGGFSLVAVHGLLAVVASLVAERGL